MLAGVLPFPAEVATAVDEYCCSHSTALPPHFAEHKEWTAENYESPDRMSSSLQAQLFIFLASDRRAKRILDIGAFSGHSALAWKEGMKALGGEVWTLEKDPVMVDACAKALKKYDTEGKIHLISGPAIETLRTLEGVFDIIFFDAYKGEYIDYLNIVLELGLLSPTGIILADDTICRGLVADDSEKNPNATDLWKEPSLRQAVRAHVHAWNEYIIKDDRVDVFLLPAFNGLSMIKLKTA